MATINIIKGPIKGLRIEYYGDIDFDVIYDREHIAFGERRGVWFYDRAVQTPTALSKKITKRIIDTAAVWCRSLGYTTVVGKLPIAQQKRTKPKSFSGKSKKPKPPGEPRLDPPRWKPVSPVKKKSRPKKAKSIPKPKPVPSRFANIILDEDD